MKALKDILKMPANKAKAYLKNTTFGKSEVESFFGEIVKEKNSKKIISYLKILFETNDENLIEALSNYIKDLDDARLKASIVKIIPVTQQDRFIPLLATFLKDKDARVRANTVEALSECGSPHLKELLLPLVNDPDNRTKTNSLIALWKCDELRQKILEYFEKMVKDQSRWMRASAFYAFGEIGLLEFTNECVEALDDKDDLIAKNAVLALIGYAEKYTNES